MAITSSTFLVSIFISQLLSATTILAAKDLINDTDHHHEEAIPLCRNPPRINNSDVLKLSLCKNVPINKLCKVECLDLYQPTKYTVKCVPTHGGAADWDVANAECRLATEVSCRDNHNHPIDWFILYKQSGTVLKSDYFMITDQYMRHVTGGFTAARAAPCLNYTLHNLYNNKSTYAMYSDHPPITNHPGSSYGHAKGVLARLGHRGFYMVHGLSNFPKFKKGSNRIWSQKNAQLFMCISFNADLYWDDLVNYVKSLIPYIYDRSVNWPKNTLVTTNIFSYVVYEFESLKKKSFQLLSKSNWGVQGNKDIYKDIISPHFKTKLLVNSWENQLKGVKKHVDCTENGKFDDVTRISYTDGGVSHSWPSNMDHANWAVSTNESNVGIFCFSDLNRMENQRRRYGGAVCMENDEKVVEWFRSVVRKTDCMFHTDKDNITAHIPDL